MSFLGYFMPGAEQIPGFFAVVATMTVFAVVGGAVGGQRRFAPADVFVGWGVATGVFIVGGVLGSVAFTWLTYGLWAAAIPSTIQLWRRYRRDSGVPAAAGVVWRILVLALPLLLMATAMKASQWDEFSQWLPNAQYIFRYDGFPGGDMPAISSAYSAYPYGLPLITYLASKMTGVFIENGGALANLLLLLLFAPLYLSLVRHGLQAPAEWMHKWGTAALGLLGVTIFSTTFIQKLVFTTYADSTTAVTLAVAGLLAWKILEALAGKGEGANSLAWQFAWVSAVLLNIKQANLSLLGLVLVGMILVAMRDPKIRLADVLRLLPVMVLPGIAVYLFWRFHVIMSLSEGEFHIQPMQNWLISDAFVIFAKMLTVASKKGAYFAMMTVIGFLAIYAMGKYKGGFARLGIITGVAFIGFNFVLWALYIIAFGKYNALHVVSYWRFNSQLGLIGCTTAAYGLAILWRRHVRQRLKDVALVRRILSTVAVFVVLAAPLATAKKIRFDIRPQKDHMRLAGQELGRSLPEGARLIIIDPHGVGLADKVINYEMTSGPGAGRGLSTIYRFAVLGKMAGELRQEIEKEAITHAWVHEPLAEVQKALNVELAPGASHLLRYADGKWEFMRSWPYGGYDDPHSLPD